MLFNSLLLTSLIHGTSFAEGRGKVSLQRKSDETVLFFSVDDQSNPICTLRQDLNIQEHEAICDLIVFYARQDKRVICLVELKGSDLAHAVEQITNTYQHLRQSLNRAHLQRINAWKACIFLSGNMPQEMKVLQRALHQTFKKQNCLVTKNNEDFERFLRD